MIAAADDPRAPRLQHLEPLVRLVRAPNPSAMTGTGTNSYILGEGTVAVIDPGPGDPAHLAALLAALDRHEVVTHIIVTHSHADHSALARPLAQATGAPVLAFGRSRQSRAQGMAGGPEGADASGWLGGGEGLDRDFVADLSLAHGEVIGGAGWALRVIHTPGHLDDHVCLAWGDRCFTGDHVMGWASSVISPPDGDMGAYMSSLDRLAQEPWSRFHPGHGEAISDPGRRIAELTAHRRMREGEILALLRDRPRTPAALTAAIYRTVPPPLQAAAERNVLAHLIDLEARNLIVSSGGAVLRATYAVT